MMTVGTVTRGRGVLWVLIEPDTQIAHGVQRHMIGTGTDLR